jgi:predicted MFS family arabinose efflux permease
LLCQSISTGYVTVTAQAGKSSAVGLYVTAFYLGGSMGAATGGIAWTLGGWPACAALIGVMLTMMAIIVATLWTPTQRPAPPTAMEPA